MARPIVHRIASLLVAWGLVLAAAIERGGPTRKHVQAYLAQQKPLSVRGVNINFDAQRVGYRYLELLRKNGQTLRA